MARIVKLSELLPEDVVFELPGGARYTFPGDPPLELILRIASLFERASGDDGDAGEIGLEILETLDREVLSLLRMRDPAIKASPFGVFGVQQIVSQLLAAYNFGVVEGDDAVPPPKEDRKTSTRSSGSRSSSRRSASSRATGGA